VEEPTTNPRNDPVDRELDALLGAYAVDALDRNERARVEAYLRVNARARDEVDELRESAAALAAAQTDADTAPAEVWDRISRAVDAESPRPVLPYNPRDELAERRARRSWHHVDWAVVVGVAATLVALALVAQVISLSRRIEHTPTTGEKAAAAGFDHAVHARGARHGALNNDKGERVARVVVLPDGSGYLKNDAMRPLGRDQTYQLWALSGSSDDRVAVSEGVLGPDPGATSFHAAPGVSDFAVTVEQAGGVAQSTQSPYATATLT